MNQKMRKEYAELVIEEFSAMIAKLGTVRIRPMHARSVPMWL